MFGSAHAADAATHGHRSSSSVKSISKKAPAKPKGQSGIEDARATQLQIALIHAGYLTGEPSGHWDAASSAAMGKLQGDNGWQTKLVPDSRAIIKLGLGPAADSAVSVPAPLAQDASSSAVQQ